MLKKAIGQAGCGLAFFLAAQCAGRAAWAGSFGVDPVRATLSAARPVVSLMVRNTGAEDTVLQLSVVGWAQEQGNDVYTATREVLATPPIFKLAPRGAQVIRLGLRRDPDPERELTYRLFLEEVPQPLQDGFSGLRVTLRIGVPVFVLPSVETAPLLRWTATRSIQGGLALSATNLGSAHAQIVRLEARIAGGPASRFTDPVYVLPGQTRAWAVAAAVRSGTAVHLWARTDRGDLSAEVVVTER
jgi:fimbrial chaperone protein